MDLLFTLSGLFEVQGEFAHPVYVCLVNLEKVNDRVLWWVLWVVLQKYGLPGPLLWDIRSLYNLRKNFVFITGRKTKMFSDGVGLHQGCPLDIWDRILRHSQWKESVHFWDIRNTSSLFAGEVIDSVDFMRPWTSTPTGAICIKIWSARNEIQHLQVWGHGSPLEIGGLLPLGCEWVAHPIKGVQVYSC